MIRTFRAFAWLRFRLFVNGLRARKNRDALETASRAGAIVVPVLLALFLLPAAVLLAALSFAGAFFMGRTPALVSVARIFLLIVTFAVLIGPVFRSIHGTSMNLTRLLLLPIPRRLLHLSEVASGIADPWLALLVPALLVMPLGFLASGAVAPAVASLLGGVLFLTSILLLGSVSAFLVQLVFRDRRRGELLALVAIMLLSLGGFLPMILQRSAGGPIRSVNIPLGSVSTGWGRLLPSELFVAVLRRATDEGLATALVPVLGLAGISALAYAVSRTAYRTLADSPAAGSPRRGVGSVRVVGRRLPWLAATSSAVAWVQFRTVLRTVTGKMLVIFNPILLGVLAYFFPRMGGHELPLDRIPIPGGVLIVAGGVGFTLLSLERVLLNQFALDRAGLTLTFLSPISDEELIVGKMAGAAGLVALPLATSVVLAFLLASRTPPLLVLCVLLGGVAAYLLFAPVAALCAAVFPRSADLTRMGSASNPHTAASLIGFFFTLSVLAPPAGLIAAGVFLGKSEPLALALVAAWTGLSAILAVPLVRFAAAALRARRENLALVAQGR